MYFQPFPFGSAVAIVEANTSWWVTNPGSLNQESSMPTAGPVLQGVHEGNRFVTLCHETRRNDVGSFPRIVWIQFLNKKCFMNDRVDSQNKNSLKLILIPHLPFLMHLSALAIFPTYRIYLLDRILLTIQMIQI